MKTQKICTEKLILSLGRDDVNLLTGSLSPSPEELIEAVIPMTHNIGFSCAGDSIACEIFENRGAVTVFLTRADSSNTFYGGQGYLKQCADSGISQEEKQNEYIYEFSDFEYLLSACREISSSDTSARLLYDGERVYLSLSVSSPVPSEFGARECSRTEATAVSERCRALPFSAAELGSLAKTSTIK